MRDLIADAIVVVAETDDDLWWAGDQILPVTGNGEFSDWFAGVSPLVLERGVSCDLTVSGFIPHEVIADAHLVERGTSDVSVDAIVIADRLELVVDAFVTTSDGGRAFPVIPRARLFPRIPSERGVP